MFSIKSKPHPSFLCIFLACGCPLTSLKGPFPWKHILKEKNFFQLVLIVKQTSQALKALHPLEKPADTAPI